MRKGRVKLIAGARTFLQQRTHFTLIPFVRLSLFAAGDVLAGEDSPEGKYDGEDFGAYDSRNTSVDRQRELAMQRARARMTSAGGATATTSLGGTAPGRTIARGAPMLSAPRMESLPGDDFDRPRLGNTLGRSGSSAANTSSGGSGGGSGGGSATLASALRERERRGDLTTSTSQTSSSSASKEMSSLGIASSYDPTLEAHNNNNNNPHNNPHNNTSTSSNNSNANSRSSTAANATTGMGAAAASGSASSTANNSRTSTAANTASAATGGASSLMSSMSGLVGGNKSDLMPIAPLMPALAPGTVNGGTGGIETFGRSPLDFSDMRRFLTTPTPRSAGVVQCYIERDKSSISSKLYPTYCVYLVAGDRFLMAAKKRGSNATSNYLISMDRYTLNKEAASFIGKLRANFVGTEFIAYDDGQSPENKGTATASTSPELRQELAVVNYASNVMGSRGPRKMRVAVPRVLPDGRRVVFQPDRDEDGMMNKFKAGHTQDMFTIVNKPPKWNDLVSTALACRLLPFASSSAALALPLTPLVHLTQPLTLAGWRVRAELPGPRDDGQREELPAREPRRPRHCDLAVRAHVEGRLHDGLPVAALAAAGLRHLPLLLRLQARLRINIRIHAHT
jgi:tubby-related protein 1